MRFLPSNSEATGNCTFRQQLSPTAASLGHLVLTLFVIVFDMKL